MASTRFLCLLITLSLSLTLAAAHDANTIQITGQACDPKKDGHLSNSPGQVDSLAVCAELCEVSNQCESATFFADKMCSHFSTNCANLVETAGAITITPQANFEWTLVAYGRGCQGGYLASSSGNQESVAKCIASCESAPECSSVTFFSSKFCSHFSDTCENTNAVAKAVSMVKVARKHTQCDVTAGEVYRSQSSAKVSDLAACKKSCEDDAECQSITFFESGFCSHFSTKCEKKQFASNAISMGLAKDDTTDNAVPVSTEVKAEDTPGWAPKSKTELQDAIKECLQHNDYDCSKGANGPIGSWDVSAVTDMTTLFLDANYDPLPGANKFNGDLSKWDVSSVTDMSHMFYHAASFNCDLSKWDVSSVTSMWGMFTGASLFNSDLSKWDVSKVDNMRFMFDAASSFDGDVSKWDVSSVADMYRMFFQASSFDGDLSKWDVSKVIDMRYMFFAASSFNGDISEWDVSRVTNMAYMFELASVFNGDLSKWDVSSVTDMYSMFYSASSFAQTLCGAWKTSTANKRAMFIGSPGKIC